MAFASRGTTEALLLNRLTRKIFVTELTFRTAVRGAAREVGTVPIFANLPNRTVAGDFADLAIWRDGAIIISSVVPSTGRKGERAEG